MVQVRCCRYLKENSNILFFIKYCLQYFVENRDQCRSDKELYKSIKIAENFVHSFIFVPVGSKEYVGFLKGEYNPEVRYKNFEVKIPFGAYL